LSSARDVSVYVHFPWCLKKCPYCDFATRGEPRENIPSAAYSDAVLREIERRADSLADARLVSVFFGGGTPSLWAPPELGRVLAAIRSAAGSLAPDLEITAECNPSSLDETSAAGLADAGINRLSIGVQSLRDEHLKFLGRLHDREGALRAIRAALGVTGRVSADLMFGMPGQTADALNLDIDELVGTGVEHISAYTLTIEPGTQFGELKKRGRLPLAPDDDVALMFEGVEARLAGHGFEHYEVSNYARAGARARHNMHYWQMGSYVGLGAAAVGCLRTEVGGRRWRNEPDPAKYMRADTVAATEAEIEVLSREDSLREAFMLGLRLSEGLDLARMKASMGADPLAGREGVLARRVASGDLVNSGSFLRVPHGRWLMLDSIVADLF
jgi:putative oxygen-independent coproporphyrinogen III oxidase